MPVIARLTWASLASMSSAPKYMQVAENCAQAECWLVVVLSEGSAALALTLCHLNSGPCQQRYHIAAILRRMQPRWQRYRQLTALREF